MRWMPDRINSATSGFDFDCDCVVCTQSLCLLNQKVQFPNESGPVFEMGFRLLPIEQAHKEFKKYAKLLEKYTDANGMERLITMKYMCFAMTMIANKAVLPA